MGALQFEFYDRGNNSKGDVSDYAIEKSVTLRLNRPSTAKGKVPSSFVPWLTGGDCALKVRLNGSIIFNGIVWFLEDVGDENNAYTDFIAVSAMAWWKHRFARDLDGDFSNPDFMSVFQTGPQIIREIGRNTITWDDQVGMDFESGVFQTGGVDLSGAPVDWPMSLGDVGTMLTDTGVVDIVETFVDDVDGYAPEIMSVCNAYNGNYGSDLSGSVSYDWWQGNYNVRNIRRSVDMAGICNSLWYYLGPKLSVQRWKANITYPSGNAPLDALILGSRSAYGKFMDIRIYDQMEMEWLARALYNELWQTESLLRLKPRELVTVTPTRGAAPSFGLGDIISVSASSVLRGGLDSSQQRVYEYTIGEDVDGVLEIGEIVTSADQES